MTDARDPAMQPDPQPGPAAAAAEAAAADVSGAEAAPVVEPGDRALFGVIDRLAAILDHSDLVELEIQVGATGLTLRKPTALASAAIAVAPGAAPATTVPGAPGGGGAAATPAPAAAPAEPPAKPSVKAPLTGIWYGSPAPGSAPYVQVGSEVAVGTVIGLIEAMKLFNEIKSDLAGRVVKVTAESGKLVKAKQPLIEVEPL